MGLNEVTTSKRDFEELTERVGQVLEEINQLYKSFVVHIAPVTDDSVEAIALRISIKRLYLVTERLVTAMNKYSNDEMAYTKWLHLPPKSIYHYNPAGLVVASDVIHAIFTRGFYEHLVRLLPSKGRPRAKDIQWTASHDSRLYEDGGDRCFPTLRDLPLCKNKAMNDILDYICTLSSYAVIPVNIMGKLVPTVSDVGSSKETDILDPGVDNRSHVENETHTRACVLCKLTNLSVGYTDVVEQSKRTKCRCVFADTVQGDDAVNSLPVNMSYYESALTTRATVNARVATLINEPNTISALVGCDCNIHMAVLKKYIINLKIIYDQAKFAVK